MKASEAKKLVDDYNAVENYQLHKIYKRIKKSAKNGGSYIKVFPCDADDDTIKSLKNDGYEIARFNDYYNGLYFHICWL